MGLKFYKALFNEDFQPQNISIADYFECEGQRELYYFDFVIALFFI